MSAFWGRDRHVTVEALPRGSVRMPSDRSGPQTHSFHTPDIHDAKHVFDEPPASPVAPCATTPRILTWRMYEARSRARRPPMPLTTRRAHRWTLQHRRSMSKRQSSAEFSADPTSTNPHGVWRRQEGDKPSPPRRLLEEATKNHLLAEEVVTLGGPLSGTSNIRGFGSRMSRPW